MLVTLQWEGSVDSNSLLFDGLGRMMDGAQGKAAAG